MPSIHSMQFFVNETIKKLERIPFYVRFLLLFVKPVATMDINEYNTIVIYSKRLFNHIYIWKITEMKTTKRNRI